MTITISIAEMRRREAEGYPTDAEAVHRAAVECAARYTMVDAYLRGFDYNRERRGNQNSLQRTKIVKPNPTPMPRTRRPSFFGKPAISKPLSDEQKEAARKVDEINAQRRKDNLPPLNQMPRVEVQPTHCCGFRYVHGVLSLAWRPAHWSPDYYPPGSLHSYYITPEEIITQLRTYATENTSVGVFAFVVVKGNGNEDICDRLTTYITENDLGKMTHGEWVRNPNSGNDIKTYLWHVKQETFLPKIESEELEENDMDGD